MNSDIDSIREVHEKEMIKSLARKKLSTVKRNIFKWKRKLCGCPPGILRCKKCGKYQRLYIVYEKKAAKMIDGGKQESFKREIYVGAKNEIARKLAEKAYLEKVIACGDNTIKCLEALTKDNKALREEALDLLPEPIRALVPYEEESEEFIDRWKRRIKYAETYDKYQEEKLYTAIDGTKMRSRAEVIIANELSRRGIPYIYEKILRFSDDEEYSPDFTMPDAVGEREIILEHFGMMGESDYCKKTLHKIKQYQKNGYLLGDNFFASFESNDVVLDTEGLMLLIDYMDNRFSLSG